MKMHRFCQGDHPTVGAGFSRRDFLHVGMLGTIGLTLPKMMQLQALELPKVEGYAATADAVIHIYLPGGMAQHES
jgi:hypothetical protein